MAGNPPTVPLPVQDPDEVSAAAIHPDDPDDEWMVDQSKRGIRVRAVTGILVVVAVLGAGFWGGVVAEKHHGSGASSTGSLASRLAALRGSGGSGAGSGTGGAGSPFGGGGGGLTTGTVIGVQGDVLEISDSSGSIVKVTVGPAATVTRTAKSSLSGLQIGDTVVVTGSTGAAGTVNATAVRASAQGVPAGGGLRGGGFATNGGGAGSGG